MNIIMFLIFLLSDLIIVLICGFSYGKKYEYREGMLLGVHIPKEALDTGEISGMVQKYKKTWLIFQGWNIAASVAVCFLCFVDFIVFMIVWTVWLMEYIAGLLYLVYHPHRKLYRIKIKNGWVREESRRIVRIDTGVSVQSDRMALSLKWHIPAIAVLILCLAVLLLTDAKFTGEDLAVTVILLVSAVEIVSFAGMHQMVIRRPNAVYSRNSEVNYAANMLTKRGWSEGMAAGSCLCAASALYLTIRWACEGWLGGFDFFVYIILQLVMAVVLILPVLRGQRRRREILEADGEALEVDDDEYWKNGWYSNPEDPHLFVPDRMNDMQYSMNMARPAAKVIIGLTAAVTVGILIFAAAVVFRFETAEVVFTGTGDSFAVDAAGYECEFMADEVESVRLREKLPEDRFVRTNGGATDKYDIGYYRGKETGKCMMFLYSGYEPILEIKLKELTVYVNSKNSEDTEEWYRLLAGADSRKEM